MGMVEISVDYKFYQEEYKGTTIPSTFFDKYINLAKLDLLDVIGINLYTIDETENEIINNLKLCQCSLADFEFKYGFDRNEDEEIDKANGVGEVKSEKAGSVSKNYVTSAEIFAQRNNEIAINPQKYKINIMKRYLQNTGLLYRGIK